MIQPLWTYPQYGYDPAIPLLGIYPEKTIIQKESCTKMFIAALFTIARTGKQPKGQDGNKDTDLLENGIEDMGRGKGKL